MSDGGNELVFCALGGLGEIGMNAALYGFGPPNRRKWLMVDCGVSFAGPDLPGIDLLMPDIGFVERIKRDLVGLVITHAHEDHIGAVADLWPRLGCRVFATPFAAGLLEVKRSASRRGADPGRDRQHRAAGSLCALRRRVHRRWRIRFPESTGAGDPHAARHRGPHGRLEDRRDPADRPADRRGAAAGARRRGRAGARLRFHQHPARRREPVGNRRRRDAAPADRRRAGPRRWSRPSPRTSRGIRAVADAAHGGRAAGHRGRPRHGPGDQRRARVRLSRRHPALPAARTLLPACRATRPSSWRPAARASCAPPWPAWRRTITATSGSRRAIG